MSDHKRNVGSSLIAGLFGFIVIAVGVLLHRKSLLGPDGKLNWEYYRPLIDERSCFLFGGLLVWWSISAFGEHKPNSWWRTGFETVTMIVGVIAALIAILALTDAASKAH